MQRRRSSHVWCLWAVGLAAFVLAAMRGRPQVPTHGLPTTDGAEPDAAERPHVEILVAAAALCVVLAGGVVGVLQMNQQREDNEVAVALTGGDPTKAADLATRYGCAGCHSIPGVPGARGQVAAPLSGLRKRVYLAGVVRNNTDNLVQWIVDPPSLSPRTAMPVTGISRQEAADMAAYLYAN